PWRGGPRTCPRRPARTAGSVARRSTVGVRATQAPGVAARAPVLAGLLGRLARLLAAPLGLAGHALAGAHEPASVGRWDWRSPMPSSSSLPSFRSLRARRSRGRWWGLLLLVVVLGAVLALADTEDG